MMSFIVNGSKYGDGFSNDNIVTELNSYFFCCH